jgi:L-malate glycosyltransferase
VHQVAAGVVPRDAISHHLLEARSVIRGMGLRSEIFADADRVHPLMLGEVRPHTAWERHTRPGDVAIVHYSIASPAFDWVLARADRVAIHYHNITPAELLWEDAPAVALECAAGRRALGGLVGRVAATAADSEFNAREMVDLGFPPPAVLGVMRQALPPAVRRPRADGGPPRLLFVGRGVPNKAQHDLILALAALRQAGVRAGLMLVGTWEGIEPYERRCRRLAERLGVDDAVAFTGSVGEAELAQAYADSDCFVCLSDHEGFCVPALEAIGADLPVVAYAAGALPETVGRAGLLLDEKQPSLVAEAVVETLGNAALARRMAEGRREQLDRFSSERLGERLRDWVGTLT